MNSEFSDRDRPPPFEPFPRVLRGSFDQLLSTREIVGRDIKRTQVRYGENVDFPAKLLQVAHHLMGDRRLDRPGTASLSRSRSVDSLR